jgi:ketosteroid isomerase-like protein
MLLAGGCAHAGPDARCSGGFDAGAVVAVIDAQRVAWNAGELEGFLAGYERSEALVFTSGGKIRRGYAETSEKYRARYGEAPETMGALAFEILDVRPLGACAEAAVVLGRWAVTQTPEAGAGVFSLVLERMGDRWRIVHDHTSAGSD